VNEAWQLLLIWLSPSFPVGSFAYSHGLEWAVEAGDINDATSLQAWLADLIEHGGLRNDALQLAAAWRTAAQDDATNLHDINELALALAPSAERLLETQAQGNAFAAAVIPTWPCDNLKTLADHCRNIAYPVALGTAAADNSIDLEATLAGFTLAFQSNLVSAALRLGTIGQSEALKITAANLPLLREAARFAHEGTLADLGSCAWRADIASMRHETQYSRLFRS
jgi:urease accessory protein